MGFSEKQRQILRFPYTSYQALICDGAVRSGKTSVMSLSFVLWVMGNFRGCSFAICGKSVGSVERNIITPLLSVGYLRRHFDIRYLRGDHMLLVRRGERENRIYLFGGKDESSYTLIQGVTLAGILLDEVVLMPRSFVEQALARCSVAGARFWFNCNPDSPRHWFYQEWILDARRHNALHLHFLMEDNPGLDAETLARYQTTYSGVFYQRYVLGEWVVAEGLVYTMFHSGLLVDEIPWQAAQRGRWFISVDYGTANPTSAGLWCLWNGTAYRVSEYYYAAAGLTDQAEAASIRLGRLKKEYRKFSRAAGLKEQRERMRVLYQNGPSARNTAKILEKRTCSGIIKAVEPKEVPEVGKNSRSVPKDVTAEYLRSATPGSHKVRNLRSYAVAGVTYTVDGHHVVLDYSPHEKKIAELLEEKLGGEIFMVPRVNDPPGISTPDYLFRGKEYDLKTIGAGAGANTIYNRIKKARRQAQNFVVDVTKAALEDEVVDEQIKKIYRMNETLFVEEIIIIRDGAVAKVVKRA